jgi:hypothetical protein
MFAGIRLEQQHSPRFINVAVDPEIVETEPRADLSEHRLEVGLPIALEHREHGALLRFSICSAVIAMDHPILGDDAVTQEDLLADHDDTEFAIPFVGTDEVAKFRHVER